MASSLPYAILTNGISICRVIGQEEGLSREVYMLLRTPGMLVIEVLQDFRFIACGLHFVHTFNIWIVAAFSCALAISAVSGGLIQKINALVALVLAGVLLVTYGIFWLMEPSGMNALSALMGFF